MFQGNSIQKRCKKVKCTLLQALRLCRECTAHRGSIGIALLFLDYDTRRGRGVSLTSRPLITLRKDPVPTVQEAGWATGPVCTSAENLAPTENRSPDRPGRSQSLYRLSYPTHFRNKALKLIRTFCLTDDRPYMCSAEVQSKQKIMKYFVIKRARTIKKLPIKWARQHEKIPMRFIVTL